MTQLAYKKEKSILKQIIISKEMSQIGQLWQIELEKRIGVILA
jgi:hypothetical protein